jgi:hypothetical protein
LLSFKLLEDIISTDWLNEDCILSEILDIRHMRFINYYTLYSDIVDSICIFNASGLICAETHLTGEQARTLTEQVEQLEQKFESLGMQLKKETQFNRKMEFNIQIKKIEIEKKQLKGDVL